MEQSRARELIRRTFENPFNENYFKEFIINLFKDNYKLDTKRPITGSYIPEAYRGFVSSYKRILKYEVDNQRIDVLVVYLLRGSSIERARTRQRNFIRDYLRGKHYSGALKDAALVAFVSDDSPDWRFSLVKMEYRFNETKSGRNKLTEDFSPARRWSFLVGPNERSHTVESRFIPILEDDGLIPVLEVFENAFNVEVVTKEFFEKYRDLFIRTKEALDSIVKNDQRLKEEFNNKNINTVDFAKKLLGQIVFLYFLQKKGWFGVEIGKPWGSGPKNFIRRLFNKEFGDYRNFYNDILEPLFYEALRTDRSADDHYYSRFNCKIPFLNGGLFDPINNYDWVNTEISLPNELFSNNKITKEGDIGDGILDVFDRYNFTVNEEEPLEKEVALDPELLGKIYEKLNAIRPDNFNEYVSVLKSGNKGNETKFNKEYGVYYTPREIVHYMCQSSLISYLETELQKKVPQEDLENFVKFSDSIIENEEIAFEKEERIKSGLQKTTRYESQIPDSIKENAETIDKVLANVKICDPAVGSGAFPIGMMHEIVKLRKLLSIYKGVNRNSYDLKRHCIENSLYGVDIDAGAVEICKLRFWLSLIVDEEDFYNLQPLPNLDFKIMRGDSLLKIEKDLFNQEVFDRIEKLKPKYLKETNPLRKQGLKNEIDNLIHEVTKGHNEFDFEVYFSEVFHQKGGFDIVIGNPPYIQLQKNSGRLAKKYESQNFKVFARTGDIYTLFYEKGIDILKPDGILTFITSNKWMRAGYGEKLRNFFLDFDPVLLIDLGPGIFESATVDTNILIIKKQKPNNYNLKAITLQKIDKQSIEEQVKQNSVVLTKLTKDAWFIGSSAEQQLKEKIERIGKPLKEWDVKIYYGIKTGLNEAFIITTEKRNEILANCKDEAERKRTEAIIKPILRGRDIKRYYYEWAGLWVIGTFPALRLNINEYPALKKYFLDNFDIRQLEQSGKKYPELGFDARKKTVNKWFETQDQIAYYPEFEKEKVVWQELAQGAQFSFDEKGEFFVSNTAYILTGNKLKYILGYLNSKLNVFTYEKWYCTKLGQNGTRWLNQHVVEIPIPPITPQNEGIVKQIEALVDKILQLKKQNPQADTSQWEWEIDGLVYKLYDLTEEEIGIIEGKR